MDKVVVLFSGGLDSTVCAEMARASGRLASLLHLQYGQANAEMEMVTSGAWARRHGLDRPLAALPILAREMATGAGTPGARYVPGRNLSMLAVAANVAASQGAREVWIGCNADDAANYLDCRPAFLAAASALTEASAGVQVAAPLVGLTKAGVVARARELGIDIGATWSCYQSATGRPCGTCDACALRKRALDHAARATT